MKPTNQSPCDLLKSSAMIKSTCSSLLAVFVVLPATAFPGTFETEVRPFLNRYCLNCHGPEKQKADLRLDKLDADVVNGLHSDTWQEVLDLVNLGEMPPQEAKLQPKRSERQAAVGALTALLREAMEAKRSTGGRNVIRRMTAYEYNNTLRDLFDLDLQYAADLPPEGSAKEGFKNNSSILGTSALHIEYFERIARAVLEKIILVPTEQPAPYFVRVEPELAFKPEPEAPANNKKKKQRKPKRKSGTGYTIKDDHFNPGTSVREPIFRLDHGQAADDGESILLAGNRPSDKVGDPYAPERKIGGAQGAGRSGYQPEFRVEMYEVPHDAPVLVRIRASAVPGQGDTVPRLSFELGSFRGAGVSDQKEAANIEIRSVEPKTYEFVVQGANFPFQSNKPGRPSYFRIFNDFRRGTSQLTYQDLPKLKIDWVEIQGNYFDTWPSRQKQAILFDSANNGNEAVYAREVLARFMPRAYRRPVTDEEIDRKLALFDKLRGQEASFEATIISTLTAVLCSSNFLLISEPAEEVVDDSLAERRQLNSYEVASRLSYFLWSSMPDATLFHLAEKDQLLQPQVLLTQVKRMIADPKSEGFSRNFASQWLDLAGVRRLAVNPEYFDFEEKTKDLFEEESIQFVHHVLKDNLSISNFIDSEFAILNPALAKHYRIPGISGGGFHPHTVGPEHHRGGLLTQSSMLFGNSTGSETHPIKRGVWVLERMLDDPPAPPPPNVPDLPEPEAKDLAGLSLKERLVEHAQVESCRDCHAKIDPWGVPFENYNALGQWREGSLDPLVHKAHQAVNIDPSTQLKNGKKIQDVDDLKNYILTQKTSQFRLAVVRKVMAYCLGRYLEFSDRSAVESICAAVEKEDDTFQALIEQIVLSEPFLTK
ncbi:MAG: DUF1592 domain-containing protein [Fuerstiella sp.]